MAKKTKDRGGTLDKPRTRREFLGDVAKVGFGIAGTATGLSSLAGCAPAPPTEATPTPAPKVEVTPTTPPTEKPFFVIATDQTIDNLDPQDFVSDAAYAVMEAVHARPTDWVPEELEDGSIVESGNPPTPVGYACEAVEVSEDGKTLTFRLRDDVKGPDGSLFTAEDMKYTYDRALERPGSLGDPLKMMGLEDPEQIVVVDPRTVEFRCKFANPIVLKLITRIDMGIMHKETYTEHAADDDPWSSTWARSHVYGAGPYQLVDWEPGVEFKLLPNPNFWMADKLKNSGMLWKVTPSPQDRLLLLKQGEVDIAWGIQQRDLKDLKQDPNIKVWEFRTDGYNSVFVNNKMPPFNDINVRKAMLHAIDYDTIIAEPMEGYAERLYGPAPTIMPTFDKSIWDQYGYEYDVDKAREYMAKSSVPDGFETDLAVLASKENWADVAVWVADYLGEIGIKVNVRKEADAPFFEKFFRREWPLALHYFRAWVNDPSYHTYYMHHSGSGINWTNYENPEVDRLLEAGLSEMDSAKREAIYKEAHKLIIQDAAMIWLFSYYHVHCSRADVKGLCGYADLQWRHMYMYKV